MAFAAVGALLAGTASAATTLAAIGTIGMTMSAVGMVTGSKSLMKLGGVLSLVGGIGGMVNGAISGGAAAVGEAAATGAVETMESAAGLADAAYGGSAAMEGAQMAGLEAMGGSEGLQSAMSAFESNDWTAMIDEASNASFNPMGDAPAMPDAMAGQVVDDAAASAARVQEAYKPLQAADPMQTPASDPTKDFFSKPQDAAYSPAADSQAAYAAMPNSGLDTQSWFKDILDWAKNNEKLATSAVGLIGGGLNGMGQMKMAQMKAEENQMRFGYGNQVANFQGRQPGQGLPLIGARR